MVSRSDIPWPRLAAETIAIVASILLAFAIDAWWENRSRLEQEQQLLLSLREDFIASQEGARYYLNGNARIQSDLDLLLEELQSSEPGESATVMPSSVFASLAMPTYSPIDATLSAAHTSGAVEMIRSNSLRALLARWQQVLDDTQEDELMVKQLVNSRIAPLLSSQVRLGTYFKRENMVAYFRGEETKLSGTGEVIEYTPEFEGAIAERHFWTSFVVSGLEHLNEILEEIIKVIDGQLRELPG